MIMALVHTLLARLLLLLIMLVFFIPTLIFLLLPERIRYHNKLCNALQGAFYWLALKASLVPIAIRGKENIPSGPIVLIANHQSSLDIPLVGSLLDGRPHVWLATNELMSSYILRFILPRVTVLVDMSSPLKGLRTLMRAINMLDSEKLNAVLFPEGGRFDDGQVHDFFGGFVILAKKTGRPVVPVRLFNLNTVYPKGTFYIKWHRVTAVVGTPMVQQEHETDEAFIERVRAWFCAQKED